MKKAISYFRKLSTAKKIQFCLASLTTLAVIVAIPIAAWFTHEKKLAVLTKVNAPSSLYINAANKEDIVNLDMSKIDTEASENGEPVTKKEYVFCVRGDHVDKYDLQLAHTTNIPFEYQIYAAAEDSTNGTVVYQGKDGEHKYKKTGSSPINGGYLNVTDQSTRIIANGSLKSRSYDNTDSVQKYADAAYWKADTITTTQDQNNEFCDYYILEVSWSRTEGDPHYVTNDKETDMIYITAAVNHT